MILQLASMSVHITEHHRMIRHPYYITAPDFNEHSSGIRVLHYLCHVLNLLGYEAYVHASRVSPNLWTPVLTDEIMRCHFLARRKPIAIYPEVVRGTPLGIGLKVRYLLNEPGKIAGHTEFDDDEITIGYRSAFVKDPATPLLMMPTSDPAVFHPGLPEPERSGRYFFFNRLLDRGGALQPLTEDAEEISPRKPRSMTELAEIFRKAELLFCYENGAISVEARMCGCPVVYLPNPIMLPECPAEKWGRMGLAWGASDDEIRHAKDTVGHFYSASLQLYEDFDRQLAQFIEMTQRAADNLPLERCYPMATIISRGWLDTPEARAVRQQSIQSARYRQWLLSEEPTEYDAVLLAERLVRQGPQRPEIHLLMSFSGGGDDALLRQSLDSLYGQLYAHWKVTVVSDQLPPSHWQESPRTQWLTLKDVVHIDYVVDEMATASSAAWIGRLEVGMTLAPQALLLMVDIVLRHPDWCLVYADEDVVHTDGSHSDPRFKPGFDLEYLRAHNYLGNMMLVRKDAFLAVGRYGPHRGANNYDLALRLVDQRGPEVFGHLPRVLGHVPAQTRRPPGSSMAAEAVALAEHLARRGLHAAIREGLQTGTRYVRYLGTPAPKVSIVLPITDELDLLRQRLNELQEQPVHEILVMYTATPDPDVHIYLQQQAASVAWRGRLQVHRSTATDWSRTAAAAALGDFLYLTDPTTVMPTAEQLAELVSTMHGDAVAAAVPRLVSTEQSQTTILNADWTLQPDRDSLSIATPFENPWSLVHYFCAHGTMAVSRLPLLVRRAVFLKMEGFDLIGQALPDAVTDLCLRLNQGGHKLIWTPHVTLNHQASGGAYDMDAPPPPLAPRRKLPANHLRQLAADAFRHPLLSIDRPGQFEHHVPMTWTQAPNEKPRIMLIVSDGEPSDETEFYRTVKRWQIGAQAQFVLADMREQKISTLTIARLMPDAVVLHASPSTAVQQLLSDLAHYLPQILRIVRIDSLGFLSLRQGANAYDARPLLRKLLRHANQAIVPTAALKTLCEGLVDEVTLHPALQELSAREWLAVPGRHAHAVAPLAPASVVS